MRVITDPAQCVIKPEHIDTTHLFWDAFGSIEREEAATILVRHMQQKGSWKGLSWEELNGCFGPTVRLQLEYFRRETLIVKCSDGLYRVTYEFVARCYGASPKLPEG